MIDKQVYINGIKIYPFQSFHELLELVMKQKGILVAINAEKIIHATTQLRGIINNNIGYCDGAGAVMALKKKGYKNVAKIPGCELWLKIVEALYKKQKKFYLIGGQQDVIEKTIIKLKKQFEGIDIVNYRNGYIKSQQEKQYLIDDIVKKKPDVVFVAIGSPRQEFLMEEMLQKHAAIYQGLGGSFDVYVGKVKRAPKWWVNNNLEFAYRLVRQPMRIKRQLHLIKFLLQLKLGRIK